MGLGEIIANISIDTQNMQRSFGLEGSLTNFVNFYQDSFKVTAPYVVESTRTLGSSFVLGHPNTGRCWLGAVNAASVVCGSQPYLGDSRSAWNVKAISSPNNTFIETFDGSRFLNINTATTYITDTTVDKMVADIILYGSPNPTTGSYFMATYMNFDISAFSGKTISAASLFLKCIEYDVNAEPNFNLCNLNIGSELTNAVSKATLLAYTTGLNVLIPSAWSAIFQRAGVNVKTLFQVPQAAGSKYFSLRMMGSSYTTIGSATKLDDYYVGFGKLNNSETDFYGRHWTGEGNYPSLKIIYTDPIVGTTAKYASGSLYFTDGSTFETNSIYTGSNTLSNIKLNLTGSTFNNLQLTTSPNGVNWETCNSASVANYNFANTGSDLRLKFTASGGNAILTKYECVYGLN